MQAHPQRPSLAPALAEPPSGAGLTAGQRRLQKWAWLTLLVNLGVIAWGAYVRASGSGAGCGDHWPTCNGEIIPHAPGVATLIELTHRLTSGVVLLMTVGMTIGAFRLWPSGSRVRKIASLTMFFMLAEAGVGAGIVLLKMVGQDDSVGRAVIMAIHLCNTFLLLAATLTTARWSGGGPVFRPAGHRGVAGLIGVNLALLLVLGASGAVTALGDTLFPAGSLAEGIAQDLSPTAHLLIRLRVLHPLGAVSVGVFTAVAAVLVGLGANQPGVRRAAGAVVALFFGQLCLGVVNLMLLAPTWAQLCHLLMADLVWMAVVWLGLDALSPPARPEPKTA